MILLEIIPISSWFEFGNLSHMKTCISKYCESSNVDITDNKIFYSCMLKILHLLKLEATVLSQIFLPFYKGHHASQTTFVCDSSAVRTPSICQRSKPATQAGPHRTAPLLGLPARRRQGQARGHGAAPRRRRSPGGFRAARCCLGAARQLAHTAARRHSPAGCGCLAGGRGRRCAGGL